MKSHSRMEAIAHLRAEDTIPDDQRQACEKLLHQHFNQLEQAGYKDPLTGLFNRSYFEHQLHHQLDLLDRYNIAFAVGLIDLDDFKAVNDQLGHAAGDQALRDVTTSLQDTVRASDIITRYGGDEFALILPHLAFHELPLILDRLRTAGTKSFPFSMGWVTVESNISKPHEIVAKADQALYEAKQAGRHAWRIVSSEENE